MRARHTQHIPRYIYTQREGEREVGGKRERDPDRERGSPGLTLKGEEPEWDLERDRTSRSGWWSDLVLDIGISGIAWGALGTRCWVRAYSGTPLYIRIPLN